LPCQVFIGHRFEFQGHFVLWVVCFVVSAILIEARQTIHCYCVEKTEEEPARVLAPCGRKSYSVFF
jgi:hypothetical protein